MSTHSNSNDSRDLSSLQGDVLDGVAKLLESWASAESASADLPPGLVDAIQALDAPQLEEVLQVLEEVEDLDDRTVRDVLGRDGKMISVHHYRSCRAEDAESSWNFRRPSPPVRNLRNALLGSLTGAEGPRIEGVQGLADAARAGKRFLFVSNHESVFDLAILPHALATAGIQGLPDRLTMFVNPKIFNIAFVNFFICKPLGLIKMPQSPRIATNESVMDADDIRRRASHGFQVAGDRLAAGDGLAIYPEGLRSNGVLHRFAKAYLDLLRPDTLQRHGLASGDVLLVPWAHRGARGLETLAPTDVTVRFGDPIDPQALFDTVGSRSTGVAGHLVGFLVAQLLPEGQRGLYGDSPETYLDHPHFRQRVREHTLADIAAASVLVERLA